jgi:hypothetical protein
MPDVPTAIPPRVHDQLALVIEKGEKRQPLIFAAKPAQHHDSTGILLSLVLFILVHDQFGYHEIFFEDRSDFFGLDKLIESATPPSPRSIKTQEDLFVGGGRSRPGLGKNFVGAGRGCKA